MSDTLQTTLEWLVLGLNFVFLLLLIRENIWCWLFGIVASVLTVILVFEAKLYSETLLYSVYIVLGIYAWYKWANKHDEKPLPISSKSLQFHGTAIGVGVVTWCLLGFFFKTYTDSSLPWADAFSTSFAFVATYLEAKKVLKHWLYWIVINLFSIWLYSAKEMPVLAIMWIGFTVFSVIGYVSWKRRFALQPI